MVFCFLSLTELTSFLLSFVLSSFQVFGKDSMDYVFGIVAEIQNFLRITKINLWSNLAKRGRGVHLHTIVDRDAEALQERG